MIKTIELTHFEVYEASKLKWNGPIVSTNLRRFFPPTISAHLNLGKSILRTCSFLASRRVVPFRA